jgi:hypothetical protein
MQIMLVINQTKAGKQENSKSRQSSERAFYFLQMCSFLLFVHRNNKEIGIK